METAKPGYWASSFVRPTCMQLSLRLEMSESRPVGVLPPYLRIAARVCCWLAFTMWAIGAHWRSSSSYRRCPAGVGAPQTPTPSWLNV